MSFKSGHCTQCGAQTMIKDVNGRICSRKENFAMVDLFFDNGQKIANVPVCKTCVTSLDYQKITDEILDVDSKALSGKSKNVLSNSWADSIPTSYALKG